MMSPTTKIIASALFAFSFAACASSTARSGFENNPPLDNGENGGGKPPGSFEPGEGPCVGLQCKQVDCKAEGKGDESVTTTLTGRVFDPAGATPLYNAIVYIPSGDPTAPLPALNDASKDGVACEPCSGIVLNPLASALTDTQGRFELKNVPVDKKVPVVVQIGKWRRKVLLDVKKSCEENAVEDGELRLPRNGDEGDMPRIAVTTGGADALECLLHGVGVDDSEFVIGEGAPGEKGHIHVFNGINGNYTGAPAADPLWNDSAKLKKYDVVLLSCEGGEHLENKEGSEPNARSGMVDYLNEGGRVFATHFHYVWFKDSPSKQLRDLASFADDLPAPKKGVHVVNTSFAKGAAFSDWLSAVDAAKEPGKIDLTDVLDTVASVKAPALSWIESTSGQPRYFSVNTPIGKPAENQCGRAVYSDLHITNTAGPKTAEACKIASGALNPQQKALEFFLFDLSACISDDREEPKAPR